MRYVYYRKIGGSQKCISELDANRKVLHRYTYFKTFREAWDFLRKKHATLGVPCVVYETSDMFKCEVVES